MAAERRRILYSGTVQGVGFRWKTVSVLKGSLVTGYVRNLPDGRVELLLEGDPEANDDAAERIRGVLGRHIQAENAERGPATGEFQDFSIRR